MAQPEFEIVPVQGGVLIVIQIGGCNPKQNRTWLPEPDALRLLEQLAASLKRKVVPA